GVGDLRDGRTKAMRSALAFARAHPRNTHFTYQTSPIACATRHATTTAANTTRFRISSAASTKAGNEARTNRVMLRYVPAARAWITGTITRQPQTGPRRRQARTPRARNATAANGAEGEACRCAEQS